MADVAPLRENVQVESVQSGAAGAESTMQIIAGSANFWNTYYEGSRGWFLNGEYWRVAGAQTGVDGAVFCPSNMEIYAVGMFNLVAGGSGSLEFDIIRHAHAGGSSSVFTTRPSIPVSSGNNAWVIRRFTDNAILHQTAGSVAPVLVSTLLTEGDMLTCNVTAKQTAGQSGGIVVFLKPRN